MAQVLITLNASRRVVDDRPQWTLQCRDGNPRERASGWVGRKFIRDRDHLLRRIDELCGNVDPRALETIRSWPPGYVQWKLEQMHTRAGPDNAPYTAISASEASRTTPFHAALTRPSRKSGRSSVRCWSQS